MIFFKKFIQILLKIITFLLFVIWTLFIKPNLLLIGGWFLAGVVVITTFILGTRSLIMFLTKKKDIPVPVVPGTEAEQHIMKDTEFDDAMREIEEDLK